VARATRRAGATTIYDRLWKGRESEMDPVKRAALFIRMNDMLTQNVVVIPIVWRNSSRECRTASGQRPLRRDSYMWRLAYWTGSLDTPSRERVRKPTTRPAGRAREGDSMERAVS